MVKVNVSAATMKRAQQVARLNELLDEFDWSSAGYADKWEWLTEEYGDAPNQETLAARFHRQMIKEGLV